MSFINVMPSIKCEKITTPQTQVSTSSLFKLWIKCFANTSQSILTLPKTINFQTGTFLQLGFFGGHKVPKPKYFSTYTTSVDFNQIWMKKR
jgi:hypothetical protein